MKSNTTRLLVRNVLHLGIGQVASTVLGVLLTAVLGRALGAADFGILYTVSAISLFVFVVTDWGQTTYLVREMARGRSDEPEVIGSALLVRLVTTVIATAAAVTIALALGYSAQIVMLTFLALIAGFPASLYAPLGFRFRGKDRMEIDAFANIAGKALTLIATAIALYLGGGLIDVVLMQGVGGILTLLIGTLFAIQLGLTIKGPRAQAIREIFVYGTPLAAFSFVTLSQAFVETMMLSAFAGPTVVGWYGASRTIFGIVNSPATITLNAFYPELSRASHAVAELRRMIDATARVLSIGAALASAGLFLFSDQIVAIIYGHRHFEQAASILRMNAIFVPLLFFVLLLATAMNAVGRNKAMFVISSIRIVFCVVFNWLLIGFWQQRFGNGAVILVIIAGVAEIPAMIACLFLLPRGAVGKTAVLNMARACVTSICTVLPISLLGPLPLWYLLPLFTLIFGVTALTTRLISASDIQLAMDILRKGMSAFWKSNPQTTPGE